MDDKIPRGVYLTKSGAFFCKFTKKDSKGRATYAIIGDIDTKVRTYRERLHEGTYKKISEPVFLFPVDFLMYGDPDHE